MIEKGAPNNEKILFENAGDEKADMSAGHITFVLKTGSHPLFTRHQNNKDLLMDLHISLLDALVGFKTAVFSYIYHPNNLA